MKDKISVYTKSGRLEVKENTSSDGIIITLDNKPILIVEESKEIGKEKQLVIKRYENKKTYINNDYINLMKYGVNNNLSKDEIYDIIKDLED